MNRVVLLICFVVAVACSENHKSPKPHNLIEKDKMIDIMYDIKLISAARSKNYKRLKDSAVKTDLYIYHKYKIDSVTLRQNLDYYATNSFKQFKDMEHTIKLRFEAEKKKLEPEIKKLDSLDKLKVEKKEKELRAFEEEDMNPKLNSEEKKKTTKKPIS